MSRRALKAYAIFIFTAGAIYITVYLMTVIGWISKMPSFSIAILLFFFAITALVYKYINQFSAHGAAMEMQFYLASIVLKLFVGCSFLVVLILSDRAQATANAVLFLISYALFTLVEILQLMAAKKD